MTGTLRRVLVRAPRPEDVSGWRAYGWRSEPDFGRLEAEHEAFRTILSDAGAEVVLAQTPLGVCPDAIYAYDPSLVTSRGAILLRPGKEGRRAEVEAMAADLVEAGVPIAGRLEAPATAEGGDTVWLDDRTLLVGRGYRTNDEGVAALRATLPDVEVIVFDLPHLHGREEVLHLMSFLSPLDVDLAVVLPPAHARAPGRATRGTQHRASSRYPMRSSSRWARTSSPWARERHSHWTATRKRAEGWKRQEWTCRSTQGDEISRKGDGGPTCLTRPLLRD